MGSKSADKIKVFAGRYAYDKPLGRGAGGAVYLAEDLRENKRKVALKVLTPEAYGTVQGKMLRREFEILSKLDHPNLVRVYDYGRLPDGGVFLAEEYIDGFSLQDARALLEPAALTDVALQILNGLAYLHGMGMIHRDIKPANVMLLWLDDASVAPMVKLVDFGLSSMDPKRDTLRGGTRSYMAPEIIRGEKGEPQSDMFSLGVTLYYALCGVLPFGPRTKDDPPPTEEKFRPPDPHRLNPDVPLVLSRFTMVLLRQVDGVEFMDAGEAMQALTRDVQDTSGVGVGRFANSMDNSAPQILRGYFERGILTGQVEERNYLVRLLADESSYGQGQLYLIAGQPQTGKSRLLREVETSCKLSNRLVVSIDLPDKTSPWGLMLEVFRMLDAQAHQHHLSPMAGHKENMAIGQALMRRGSNSLLIDRQKRWIQGALVEVSKVLRDLRPVVFVDDLHKADEQSRDFLTAWFSKDDASHCIDFVVTTVPVPELESLSEITNVRPVVIDGLEIDDVAYLFVDRMGVESVPDDWKEAVVQRAVGQPAYLEEVCRNLLDSGALRRNSMSDWSLDVDELNPITLPSGLRESFRRRLNVVGAAGRELLELLVIMERPVEWAFLRRLAVAGGESESSVDRTIETLKWRHLIRVDLEMSGRYISLIHPAVREVVELLFSPQWRSALHRRIGEELMSVWTEQGGDIAEVAKHLAAGGRAERGAMAFWAAGQAALTDADWENASAHLSASAKYKHSDADTALLSLNRARAALAIFEPLDCLDALAQAERAAENSSLDWLMFHTMTQAAQIAWEIGAHDQHASLIANLHDYLPVMTQQPRCLEARGQQMLTSGKLDEAGRHFEMARVRYQHFGNMRGVLRCSSALAGCVGVRSEFEAAGAHLESAYELAREFDLRMLLGEALVVHARLVRQAGDAERALSLLHDALEAVSHETSAALWVEVLLEFSLAYIATGELGGAEQRAIEALLLSRQLEHVAGECFGTILVSGLAVERALGKRGENVQRVEEACERLTRLDNHLHWQPLALDYAGDILERFGMSERAVSILEKSAKIKKRLGCA